MADREVSRNIHPGSAEASSSSSAAPKPKRPVDSYQMANNTLQIPDLKMQGDAECLNYSYLWRVLGGVIEGHAGRAFEPLLVTVECTLQNYRWKKTTGTGKVDDNPGRLLWAGYPMAFELARHRFNLRNNSDAEWAVLNPTATPMFYTQHRGKLAEAAHGAAQAYQPQGLYYYEGNLAGRRMAAHGTHADKRNPISTDIKRAFSMVRATIENMPFVAADKDQDITPTMTSDNVFILPDDELETTRRMYTSMARKYFSNNNEGTMQFGSEGRVTFSNGKGAELDNLRINYQFLFVKGPAWVPLPENVGPPVLRYEEDDPLLFRKPDNNNNTNNQANPVAAVSEPSKKYYFRDMDPVFYGAGGKKIPPPSSVLMNERRSIRKKQSGPPAHNYPTRSKGSIGGDNTMGIYAQLKARIYVRRSLEDFFIYSKACIGVPATEEKLCFPMAFMRCQLRTWTRKVDEDGSVREIEGIEEDQMDNIGITNNEANPTLKTSFYEPNECIRVFDCSKQALRRQGSHGKTIYKNELIDLSEEEVDCWKWCAHQVHYCVEDVWGKKIDMEDLDECLRSYSYVFAVNIAVFTMEMKGERVMFEILHDVNTQPKLHFIGMILQNEHLHAISNMRHYHRSQVNPLGTTLHAYCDFCNTMNYTRMRDNTHANKCFHLDGWKVGLNLSDLHNNEAEKLEYRDRYRFLKPSERIRSVCMGCYSLSDVCTSCVATVEKREVQVVQCKICSELVGISYFNKHVCYMKARKPKENLKEESIFVYDIESAQNFNEEIGQYVHDCILVCLKAVYDDRQWSFETIPQFVRFLIDTKEMQGATILAHNGGGYDHQFVLRYLEDSAIQHSVIPRPNTVHKYLLVEITMSGEKTAIRFLDFLMFMTDSLRNIGAAFKLDVCKGDFPHRFSKMGHLEYKGRLPSMTDEADWYGFKEMKSQVELDEARLFWTAQTEKYCACDDACNCSKPLWDFKKELEAYCWQDVYVLAGACKAYRDQALNFHTGDSEFGWTTNGIDPFRYMTQSQIALALFTQGKEQNDIVITHEKLRPSFRPAQIMWMEELMEQNPRYKIQHAGNSFKEYYDVDTRTFCDGYCHATKTVFEYLCCELDGCGTCYAAQIAQKKHHPVRNIPWDKVHDATMNRILALKMNNNFHAVVVLWEHERMDEGADETMGCLMKMRDAFYGGRTEVFSAYANIANFPDHELLHHDVSSLYPYVCSIKDLPLGQPTIYFNTAVEKERLNPNHPDPYFGFARVRVKPNTRDFIGILPERIDEKLTYNLLEKTGSWHTEMIYLAMEHQYEIMEVYEVWHWPPNQRSSTLMRGYMSFFLRMKQESEGFKKLGRDILPKGMEEEEISEEWRKQICDLIYMNNGGFARPRIGKVEKNPVLRQLAKIFLNCLWGKLCQKNATELERFIYGYKQYLEICTNPMINLSTLKFRHVNGSVFKVRYELADTLIENNRFLNIPIAASVTAHAQVILMRQMFKVGPENVLYCDTDSIMFLRKKGMEILNKSGLGNWEKEHADQVITRFWALAPKVYMMEIQSEEEIEYYFKCKGVRSTEVNRQRTTYDKIHALVEADFFGRDDIRPVISADTMIIHPNSTNSAVPYGTLCTRYGVKRIRIVFSKRELCVNVDPSIRQLKDLGILRLVPFGYEGDLGNECGPQVKG